jgi:lysozyme
MTDDGLEILKVFEAFRDRPYDDGDGNLTVGFGHMILPGEKFPGLMSKPAAEQLLVADVAAHEKAMLALVQVPLFPYEQDALASFVFNLGAGHLAESSLLTSLNRGDRKPITAEKFLPWVFAGNKRRKGLVRRRNGEAARFLGASLSLVTSIYEGGW